MTTYNVFCDTCETEYSVTPSAGVSDLIPTNCSYCGSQILEETITEVEDDWTDEDWDSLIEDEWNTEEDDR
jgi:DNA-directed RNA polymerase subunit RPC12/RpoP